MFYYFQDNYGWHTHFHMALLRGGNMSEIERFCGHLKELSNKRDPAADEAWFDSWGKLGNHVEQLAKQDEEAGYRRSAGRKYQRASIYYFTAEKMLNNLDQRKMDMYKMALENFRKGIEFRNEAVEWIEIPFEDSTLPALFIPAAVDRPAPCMVHFNGYDGIKEIVYQRMGDEYRNRGTALLLVDQPGTGEALRLRNLHLRPNSEVIGSACLDYLETRADVDPERIGVMGISFGSYHAPRAAAFEKRFKCCVSWGGYWSPPDNLNAKVLDRKTESVPPFHRRWVTGKSTDEEAAEVMDSMTLEGIVDKITCPFLVVYGENDQLVPQWAAEKAVNEAINSPNRKLKIFTAAEGGSEHCQNDNNTLGLDYTADWISEVLVNQKVIS